MLSRSWKPGAEHLRSSVVLIALCVALYSGSSSHSQTRSGAAVHEYTQKSSVISPLLKKIFVVRCVSPAMFRRHSCFVSGPMTHCLI